MADDRKLLRFYDARGREVGWCWVEGASDADRYEAGRARRAEWRRKGVKI